MRPSIAGNSLLQRRIAMLASSCFLVLFMNFCTITEVTFKEAPANSLSLCITIRNQYTTPTNQQGVFISITFSQGNISAALDGPLSIVCEGIKGSRAGIHVNMTMDVPRQPAGGAYQCVYTDEKGTKTPLNIPIPAGALAITSPAAVATVHVTDNPTLPPGVTPTPTPVGSPTPAPTLSGAAALVSALEIHYTLPQFPANKTAQENILATCGGYPDVSCGVVGGQSDQATGVYLLSGVNDLSGAKFHDFIPGTNGSVELFGDWSWSMPSGGFKSIHIEYDDSVRIPVIWA